MWIVDPQISGVNYKKICPAGECCSKSGRCGTSEEYCGANCNYLLTCGRRCGNGLTTTAGGPFPERGGPCISSTDSAEGESCTVRGRCVSGLKCLPDPSDSTAKRCVKG